ncbi:MAG: hypothetical protein E6I08_09015 [Chloroflexi bacterium]|nr:MAG: hypothetical protein E6I08_09015 [Chloroflexota bacterium]
MPPGSKQLDDLRNVATQRQAKLRHLADRASAEVPRGSARTIAVYSPKGGSGKSTVAVNLAGLLARRAPGHVLLFDLALPYNDCALLTRLTPTTCLARFADAGPEFGELLSSAVLSHPGSSLNVLSAAIRPEEADLVSPQLVERALEALRLEFQFLVVDLGITLSDAALTILERSDQVLVVLTPELSSLKAFTQLSRILQDVLQVAAGHLHVVINHRTPHSTMNRQEIEALVNYPVAAEIRYQGARLEQSALEGKLPAYDDPHGQLGQAMALLARQLDARRGRPAQRLVVGGPVAAGRRRPPLDRADLDLHRPGRGRRRCRPRSGAEGADRRRRGGGAHGRRGRPVPARDRSPRSPRAARPTPAGARPQGSRVWQYGRGRGRLWESRLAPGQRLEAGVGAEGDRRGGPHAAGGRPGRPGRRVLRQARQQGQGLRRRGHRGARSALVRRCRFRAGRPPAVPQLLLGGRELGAGAGKSGPGRPRPGPAGLDGAHRGRSGAGARLLRLGGQPRYRRGRPAADRLPDAAGRRLPPGGGPAGDRPPRGRRRNPRLRPGEGRRPGDDRPLPARLRAVPGRVVRERRPDDRGAVGGQAADPVPPARRRPGRGHELRRPPPEPAGGRQRVRHAGHAAAGRPPDPLHGGRPCGRPQHQAGLRGSPRGGAGAPLAGGSRAGQRGGLATRHLGVAPAQCPWKCRHQGLAPAQRRCSQAFLAVL